MQQKQLQGNEMEQAAEKSKYMTVREICDELSLSRWTVYRMIENGTLKGKRFGRSIRVLRQSYNLYIENV